MEKHDRLRQARIKAGFGSAADAARRLNVSYGTYSGHENGSRGIKDRDLIRYSQVFGVAADWLIFGTKSNFAENCLIFGIGKAGHIPDGRVDFYNNEISDRALVLPPYLPENTGFIEVQGTYLRGIADDGWTIFCKNQFVPPDRSHIGLICVCRLGGRNTLIRTIMEGSGPDSYDLEGPLFPTLRDQKILEVSPIYMIMTELMLRHVVGEMQKTLAEVGRILNE